MTQEQPTMKTPITDAIIASDTGDSGFIAELVQQCRSFEEENKELREVCDKQAQMLACQAKRNADLFQELQNKNQYDKS